MSKTGFNYEISSPYLETNTFKVVSSDYVVINDSNNNVYTSNIINFNSNSLVGAEPSKAILLSESLLQFPYSWQVELTGGKFFPTGREIYACCLKNHYSLIDRIYMGVGSTQDLANSASYFRNLYINENMKRRSVNENELLSEISTCEFDNDKSLVLYKNSTLFRGEVNNDTGLPAAGLIEVPREFINKAIIKRNLNRFRPVNGVFGGLGYTSAEIEAQETLTSLQQQYIPHYKVEDTKITFYDVVTLRLADLHSFFKQMNYPLGQLTGFTLKAVLNAGVSTVEYGAVADVTTETYVVLKPVLETYVSSSGFTNPFLLSSVAHAGSTSANDAPPKRNDGSDGIFVRQTTNATGIKLTVRGNIGWGDNGMPARISVPQIKLQAKLATEYFGASNIKTILFNDFLIDEIKNVSGTGNINYEINQQVQRPRKLYIIPFLSNTNSSGTVNTIAYNMVSPYQSCLSSAPITCSKLRIRDLQVRIGGTNVYPQSNLIYGWQFYDLNKFSDLNKLSGNSSNSVSWNGLITKSMFNNAYGVYTVDLMLSEYQKGKGGDDDSKRISVQWRGDGVNNLNYDYVLLVEYQKEVSINITNCTLDKNPDLQS